MLLRKLSADLPNWRDLGPLVVTELLVLAMTVGVVALAIARWHRTRRDQRMALAAEA
jgi:hypothetical protein